MLCRYKIWSRYA